MSDIQSLHTLLEQATTERDGALGVHQRALASLRAAQTQGVQLADYRQEYVRRFGAQFQGAGAIALLQCYQGFMARLDDAVSQQMRIAEQAGHKAEDAKTRLLASEMRVASVRRLIERRQAEAARRGEQREQKSTDEFASRAAWQRGAHAAAPGDAAGAALGFGYH